MAELTVDLTYGTALMEAARDLGARVRDASDNGFVARRLSRDKPA